MKNIFLAIFISIFYLTINAQNGDDKVYFDNAFLISPSYTFQLPAGDMIQSYGFNHNISLEFSYKIGKNWLIGAEGGFMFGSKAKDKELVNNLLTDQGSLIGKDGRLEDVNLSGRGMNIMAKFGKIIHFSPKNPNSGLMLKFGVGYIDHKIYINVNEKNVTQLTKEIRTGYDRFSSGVAFSQYVGLIKLEKNKFLNIAFGIEATEGITQNRRPFDFATGKTLNKTRFDFLVGFKFNWYIPVFMGTSTKSDYYYY